MSGSEDRPVADIEGIGPVRAQALASAGIRTVFDLLHVPEAILVGAVSSLASPADVRAWVTAALLLQIDRMTPQWAQALVAAGVDSLGEIHRKRLDALETLFATARNSGLIPEVPTAPTIAAMMTDAAILAHTGTIAGRVVDATGAAVAGATVYAGGASSRTDDRGRFRLGRVPLAPGVRLRIEHPDHPALEVANPRTVADPEAIALRLYRLPAATGDSATPSAPLSELSGDAIPLGPGAPFREIVVAASSFSAGDLLRIVEISSDEVAVVSLLRSYEDGNVVVRKARLPRSSVQGEPARGGLILVGPTGFELVSMSVKEIHRYRLHLRLARAFDGRPAPTTRGEARALAMEKMKFLQDAGWFLHGAGGHQ
jgi:hypothetical protein